MSSAIFFDDQRQTYDASNLYMTSNQDANAMHR